jgi:hypothetical protein
MGGVWRRQIGFVESVIARYSSPLEGVTTLHLSCARSGLSCSDLSGNFMNLTGGTPIARRTGNAERSFRFVRTILNAPLPRARAGKRLFVSGQSVRRIFEYFQGGEWTDWGSEAALG